MNALKPIDWAEAFRWLEMGYRTSDIALLLATTATTVSRRARQELSPERYVEWKRLNRRNRRPECGTYNGYQSHLAHGEEACRPCKDAWAAKNRVDYDSNRRRK